MLFHIRRTWQSKFRVDGKGPRPLCEVPAYLYLKSYTVLWVPVIFCFTGFAWPFAVGKQHTFPLRKIDHSSRWLPDLTKVEEHKNCKARIFCFHPYPCTGITKRIHRIYSIKFTGTYFSKQPLDGSFPSGTAMWRLALPWHKLAVKSRVYFQTPNTSCEQ